MLNEIRWRPLADAQYRAIIEAIPGARGIIDGAVHKAAMLGARLPLLPGPGTLYVSEARHGGGLPRFVLIVSRDRDRDDLFWVEEIQQARHA